MKINTDKNSKSHRRSFALTASLVIFQYMRLYLNPGLRNNAEKQSVNIAYPREIITVAPSEWHYFVLHLPWLPAAVCSSCLFPVDQPPPVTSMRAPCSQTSLPPMCPWWRDPWALEETPLFVQDVWAYKKKGYICCIV